MTKPLPEMFIPLKMAKELVANNNVNKYKITDDGFLFTDGTITMFVTKPVVESFPDSIDKIIDFKGNEIELPDLKKLIETILENEF